MRFLVDMALSPETVKFLQALGHKAIRANELGMANDLFFFASYKGFLG